MSVELDSVVPWGRSLDEYRLMFDLSELDLASRILGCGDGPASFNAEMARLGHRVVSFDPIYAFTKDQIRTRVHETYPRIIDQCKANSHNFAWNYFADPDALGRGRLAAMEMFLDDLEAGLAGGRYVVGELPNLDFHDRQFDLALCSHLLFLYTGQLSLEFHLNSIDEMRRVAGEVRIFPLLDLHCDTSAHVQPVIDHVAKSGGSVEIVPVNYEMQRGGTKMMRITSI